MTDLIVLSRAKVCLLFDLFIWVNALLVKAIRLQEQSKVIAVKETLWNSSFSYEYL